MESTQPQQQQQKPAEKLDAGTVEILKLETIKTRAVSLFKSISRMLEDFDAYGRTNTTPKWQDVLGQYMMINLELYNIVKDVKSVSEFFVVLPKNVNAENAAILPVMLSSKLLPEMETDDNVKREQLLQGVQSLPVPMQIERLKARIDMIEVACRSAEKVLADTRKAYGFGIRQGPSMLPTLDKVQAAKIQEQENMLRAAVNDGAGTRLPPDQRQVTTALPPHLADVLNDAAKNPLPVATNNINSQGNLMQVSGTQFMGRSAASPSGPNFDNTTSPLPYANSPRSTGMVNAPSPQQLQQQQLQQQQQRAKLMQLPQHQQQQLLAQQQQQQQQLRQSSMQGMGQSQIPSLHDLHGQSQQKFQTLGQHQMSYSQPMAHQQFQARQLSGGQHMQHSMSQGQLNPTMNRHLNQFSSGANSALFTSAQGSPSSQMIPNMSSMQSQTLNPRMQQQFGVSGTNPQRGHASQMLGDQMFNSSGMMQTQQSQTQQPQQQQQQQQNQQGGYGNMQTNQQTLQPNMLQNTQQQQQQQQRHQNPQ